MPVKEKPETWYGKYEVTGIQQVTLNCAGQTTAFRDTGGDPVPLLVGSKPEPFALFKNFVYFSVVTQTTDRLVALNVFEGVSEGPTLRKVQRMTLSQGDLKIEFIEDCGITGVEKDTYKKIDDVDRDCQTLYSGPCK